MSIADLGSLGEFVSSFAVLVTLIYLAIQVRQTTRAVQSSSWQTGLSSLIDINQTWAKDPELVEIFQRATANPHSMNQSQWTRYGLMMASLFHVYQKWFLDSKSGLVDLQAWRAEEESMLAVLSTPGARKWWDEFPVPYTTEFRAHVNGKLASAENSEWSNRWARLMDRT